ncbi:ARP6 Actin-like protein ARP6 [Candida maltosa Xu316]|uniref:Actin-like protein ARP6 n=1 Tax=Candida maltosa (strain Xu316) TaxID=1245528 RepID=M3K323_CANMX|nr:hypothetical protein G210_5513 [Candida maltosa Xu316]
MTNLQTLVIDNGSYNIKAGFNKGDESTPIKITNAITKTKDGLIHIGNEYQTHTNNYSGIQFRRPFEQGNLTSWETEKPIWDYTLDNVSENGKLVDPSDIHLLLTEQPFQLPQLSTNTDQIVFEEYGFSKYYRCIPPSLVPFSVDFANVNTDFCLIIDSGFQSTWIIPMIYQQIHWQGVRKLPVGGKLLNGLLREIISFRHYDMSEDPILINTIKESTCFMSQDFIKDLNNKKDLMCEFVLPDFKTTTTGFVKNETNSQNLPSDTQILKLYDERFTVPETFFHPEILFDNNGNTASNPIVNSAPFKNLPDLIVESIMSCPEITRPLLSANICLSGGSTNIGNFKSRLSNELRKELPTNWKVRVFDKQQDYKQEELSWYGGINLSEDENLLSDISISKKDYFEHGANWCQKQFGFKNV